MLCCRSAAELRGRDLEDLGRWDTMLSLDNEVRCTMSVLYHRCQMPGCQMPGQNSLLAKDAHGTWDVNGVPSPTFYIFFFVTSFLLHMRQGCHAVPRLYGALHLGLLTSSF